MKSSSVNRGKKHRIQKLTVPCKDPWLERSIDVVAAKDLGEGK